MGFGVNLAGFSRAEMGLGESVRSLARSLDAARIPFTILNVHQSNPSRHEDRTWAHKESDRALYDISIVNVLPDVFEQERARLPAEFFHAPLTIAYALWELPELPSSWVSWANSFHEIWAPSFFVMDAFSAAARVPVVRIPCSIEAPATDHLSREQIGLPPEPFLFLTMFDPYSLLERKNPMAVVEAFQTAFSPSDPGVALVVKVNNPDAAVPALTLLKERVQGWPNIVLLPLIMTPSQKKSLVACSDCVVSLHRSEGFGLVGAEAMSHGKPCILTGWSANTDYMVPGGAYPVRYRLVPLAESYGPYEAGQMWAEPDVDHAAQLMRRVFERREESSQVGRRGQEVIRRFFSPEAVGRKILSRLQRLQVL